MRSATFCYAAAAATVILASGVAAPQLAADVVPLDEAKIIFEVNSTDEDAGIQIFLDGEGWRKVKVFDPDGRKIFDVKGMGSVGALGLTELFFESEEPELDELPLEDLFILFPEGEYTFRGITVEHDLLVGSATLTHAIPDGPVLLSPSGDDVDPSATVVEWLPVADPPGSAIVGYQVIVEREEPTLRVFSVDLSADATSVTVPPEFMEPGTEYKFEVLAIEVSGNQTISEAEFETAEE